MFNESDDKVITEPKGYLIQLSILFGTRLIEAFAWTETVINLGDVYIEFSFSDILNLPIILERTVT